MCCVDYPTGNNCDVDLHDAPRMRSHVRTPLKPPATAAAPAPITRAIIESQSPPIATRSAKEIPSAVSPTADKRVHIPSGNGEVKRAPLADGPKPFADAVHLLEETNEHDKGSTRTMRELPEAISASPIGSATASITVTDATTAHEHVHCVHSPLEDQLEEMHDISDDEKRMEKKEVGEEEKEEEEEEELVPTSADSEIYGTSHPADFHSFRSALAQIHSDMDSIMARFTLSFLTSHLFSSYLFLHTVGSLAIGCVECRHY